ncbi:DUF6207 family protein [Streptomyces longwoodensis]|uniref:DUF6207 family protein n=1 Tax=Streptomyces longwoodensis TaxID=68231 RepID=UPI0033D93A3E
MREITDAHVTEPGLAVVEVAAADDATAFAVQQLLAAWCVIAPADRTVREPGEPGVRLRCFLDVRAPVQSPSRHRQRGPAQAGLDLLAPQASTVATAARHGPARAGYPSAAPLSCRCSPDERSERGSVSAMPFRASYAT